MQDDNEKSYPVAVVANIDPDTLLVILRVLQSLIEKDFILVP